jgi:hypothetical protein
MATEIEISSLDLRYEGYRMKNSALEGRLLASIAQCGIQEPLEGVRSAGSFILLNGFKRFRCARQLQIRIVPVSSLGQKEVDAILNLLRVSNDKTLGILEQARFLTELKQASGMSLPQIAESLSRSKSWVSMRLTLVAEMSPSVRDKLLGGAFPVYAYMYTVRPFMRMNGVSQQRINQFVEALSGHKLSLREIEQLTHGFFRGPDSFREQILSGNIALPLQRMKEIPADAQGCSEFERLFLHDLELAQKYIQRILGKSQDPRLQSHSFHAQCHLLTAGILSRAPTFHQSLRTLHDRCGQA